MKIINCLKRNLRTCSYCEHHRNWFLTIMHIKMPMVLFGACAIAIIITLLTFLIDPIYEAKTFITLDANLSRILKNVDTSYTSTTMSDYIRYEFFATHSVMLMHAPQLADRFIKMRDIKDSSNKIMFSGYFIKPNLFRLLFSNNGQAINAQWVSDTQQFIISGYAKDPDTAVAYSKDYTELFLKENANNTASALDIIVERLGNQISEINSQIESVDRQIQQTKKRYFIGDVDHENETIINKIYTIKSDLSSAYLDEQTYKARIDHLYREADKQEVLKKYQKIMESNPNIQTLKDKIQELTRTLVGYSVELTKEHPSYKVVEKTLDQAKEALKKEAQNTLYQEIDQRSELYETVMSQILTYDLNHIIHNYKVEHYNSLLKMSESRLEELIMAKSELDKLNNRLTHLTGLLSTSLTNHSNVRNIKIKPISFFSVVSSAYINKDMLKNYRYFPKRKHILMVTFIASLFMLSFFVIAKELYSNTLFCGWQLTSLNFDVDYADIPFLQISAASKYNLDNAIGMHIRELCSLTKEAQFVRVTSGSTGEGKSTIAHAMAMYYYKMGQSVVLVDGDLTNRSLSISCGLNNRPGLIDYIYGRNKLADIITRDEIANVSFIPTGDHENTNPESFNLNPLNNLFSTLASNYRKIIFIDEPLKGGNFMLADMLPHHEIILVLKSGHHSIYEVNRFLKTGNLREGYVKIRGIIVNRIMI